MILRDILIVPKDWTPRSTFYCTQLKAGLAQRRNNEKASNPEGLEA
jgi:hypothetical protein